MMLRDSCSRFLHGQKEIVWEIGSGHGHFLTAYAAANPDRLCVGIDIVLERVRRADRKRERAHLANLHFLQADARDFLDALPAGVNLGSVYMLFPDPWPKRRHRKNRLLEPSFLHEVAKRAGQGTRLYFRTDYKPYFAEAAALVDSHPDWETRPGEAWPFDMPTVFQEKATDYQSLVARRKGH